jgi:hypothetical protein
MTQENPLAPTLTEFITQVRDRNVARPTMYYVEIMPPGPALTSNKLVSMWCHAAHTPQISLSTNENFIEAGVRRKYAYDIDYQHLVLNFYIDQNYEVKRFFDDWRAKIVPYHRRFNYPDSYTAESLNLYLIDAAGVAVYKYEYKRVFPKTIQSVELSYTPSTGPSTFSVEFAFEDVYFTALNDTDSQLITTSAPPDFTNLTPAEIRNVQNTELTQRLNPKARN